MSRDGFEIKMGRESRLLDALFTELSEIPKTRVRQLLKFGSVTVNGRPVTRFDHALKRGDTLAVRLKNFPLPVRRKAPFRVLYADDNVLVIDKPAGILSIASDTESENTVHKRLNDFLAADRSARAKRVFIVHRLDRDTSGLMVFARSTQAQDKMQKNWDKTKKTYLAVIEGRPRKTEDTLLSYLMENTARKVYSAPEGHGAKRAVTHYRVLKTHKAFTLLEVTPETGRKNQIRVHMADMGHPIAGDKKYGSTFSMRRIALHAWKLGFTHPETEKWVTFESPMPESMARLVGYGRPSAPVEKRVDGALSESGSGTEKKPSERQP